MASRQDGDAQSISSTGYQTVATVSKRTPTPLADEVSRIGFIRAADAIAQNRGWIRIRSSRNRAGIYYALNQLAKEGHVFSPREPLVAKCAELHRHRQRRADQRCAWQRMFTNNLIHGNVGDQTKAKRIEAIYLPLYYRSEVAVRPSSARLRRNPPRRLRTLYASSPGRVPARPSCRRQRRVD